MWGKIYFMDRHMTDRHSSIWMNKRALEIWLRVPNSVCVRHANLRILVHYHISNFSWVMYKILYIRRRLQYREYDTHQHILFGNPEARNCDYTKYGNMCIRQLVCYQSCAHWPNASLKIIITQILEHTHDQKNWLTHDIRAPLCYGSTWMSFR